MHSIYKHLKRTYRKPTPEWKQLNLLNQQVTISKLKYTNQLSTRNRKFSPASCNKACVDIYPWWLRRVCVSSSSSSVFNCWLSLHLVSFSRTHTHTHRTPTWQKTSGSISNSSPQVLCYKLPSIQLLHQLVLTAVRQIIGSTVKK